jgi:sugar lactone lactonase YvrE
MAVDAAGDVYYADGIGNGVYVFPAGMTVKPTGGVVAAGTYTTIGSGLTTPGGVGLDSFGDLIITDTGNNRLVEIPYANGALETADQYLLSYTYSANGTAVDSQGHIYFSGYNANIPPPGGTKDGATTIGEMTLWNANLGSISVGASGSPLTLNYAFNSPATPMSISVLPAGGPFAISAPATGACAAGTAQVLGSACSVTATYTPSDAGTQPGAVVLADSTGTAIATGYLYGAGLGAAQSVDPGTVASIGNTWQTPEGIAVDFALNVYVADSTASAVSEYSPGGTLLASIGSGLKGPSSVAVDAAGNVYIADAGNGRVVEVPVVNGALSNTNQGVVYSGISGPAGLSVDAGGNLYIADSGNDKVWRLPNRGGIPDSTLAAAVGSGFTAPLAVTTDLAGDVFVADSGNVYEVQAQSGAQQAITSAVVAPGGIALDASGSLYIADTGKQQVIRIPNENGSLNPNDRVVVGAGIANPYAVAVDSSANLYITDSLDALVDQVVRSQGTLQFPPLNLGTASGPETATIANAGNQTLTFGASLYSEAGDTGSFTVSDSAAGNCADGATLAPGLDCTLIAVFSPTKPGTNQETLTFSSSAVAPSSLILVGQGAALAPTQLSVAVTSPASGTQVFSQPVTVSATLTASGGFATLGAPTGSVSFSVDGQVQGSSPISSTGSASFQLTSLSGGVHTVTAAYSGDNNYESSSTTTPASVTITQLPTASALAISGADQNPLSAPPGSSITLTATITPYLTPGPTGTVTFLSGSTALGSAPVVATPVQNGTTTVTEYIATLVTTTLPAGTLNVVASYGGDVNYAASQSASTTLIVSPVTISITPATTSLTVTDGTAGSLTFTVTSLAGFTGPIAASCSGLPAYSACAFTFTGANGNPGVVGNGDTLNSGYPQQVVVEILTGQVPTEPQPPVGELRIPGTGYRAPVSLALLLLAPLGLVRRRLWKKVRGWMLLVVLLCGTVGAVTMTGCGNKLNGVTPAGQTTVSLVVSGSYVNGAAATVTVTQTAQIALTVQK